MVMIYSLSVFAINFFILPSFSNFKIRLINQQTGDCTDSQQLYSDLSRNSFPVPIRLKGAHQLIMKVKMIDNKQQVQAQGVISFNKNQINTSLRVPLYDIKQGVEEVALCTIELFLSGYTLEKNNSILQKSRNIEDLRQRSQDAIYSQMSYTVESQRESKKKESERQKQQKMIQNKMDDKKKNQIKKTNPENQEKKNKTGFKNSLDRVVEYSQYDQEKQPKNVQIVIKSPSKDYSHPQSKPSDQQNPLSRDKSKSLHKDLTNKKQPLKKLQSAKKFMQSEYESERQQQRNNQNKYLKSQKIEQKLLREKSFEAKNKIGNVGKITKRGSKELSNQKEKIKEKLDEQQQKPIEKYKVPVNKEKKRTEVQGKGKLRRLTFTVEEISSLQSPNNFIRYFFNSNIVPKRIKNMKVSKCIYDEVKQKYSQQQFNFAINKLTFLNFEGTKKIAQIDWVSYKSYCLINKIAEEPVQINLPNSIESSKVLVQVNREGQFFGVIGLQEGKQMSIVIAKSGKSKYQQVLSQTQYRFYFDIDKGQIIERKGVLAEELREEKSYLIQQDVDDRDIKKRITSLSLQPWGYVQKQVSTLPSFSQQKTIQNLTFSKKDTDNLANHSALSLKHKQTNTFDDKQYKFLHKRFYTSDQNTELNDSYSPTKKNKEIKVTKLPHIKLQDEYLSDINSIRNGNRNKVKIKIKESPQEKKIKKLWQKLLIKNKIEQDKQKQLYVNERQRKSVVQIQKKDYSRINKTVHRPSNTKNFESDEGKNSLSSSSLLMQTKKPIKPRGQVELLQQEDTKLYPLHNYNLQIKNISITQPQIMIEHEDGVKIGKFVKIWIAKKVAYYTQVIFNCGLNSILWKLEGCNFTGLVGNEKLDVQIYETVDNRVDIIGKSHIRFSKILFLRKNHIYNGRIMYEGVLSGQFTLGFEVQQQNGFEVIQEVDENFPNYN